MALIYNEKSKLHYFEKKMNQNNIKTVPTLRPASQPSIFVFNPNV